MRTFHQVFTSGDVPTALSCSMTAPVSSPRHHSRQSRSSRRISARPASSTTLTMPVMSRPGSAGSNVAAGTHTPPFACAIGTPPTLYCCDDEKYVASLTTRDRGSDQVGAGLLRDQPRPAEARGDDLEAAVFARDDRAAGAHRVGEGVVPPVVAAE